MQYAEEDTDVRVTLPQFFADKLSAILHATLCLHRGYNPFTIYREKLNAKATLAQKKFEQRQEARLTQDVASDDALKEYKVMSLDSLAALIASQESLVSSLEESVENADGEQLFQEEDFDNIYENALLRYKAWETYLQRPPHSEKIDYDKLFRMSKPDDAGNDSHAKTIPDIEADLNDSKFSQFMQLLRTVRDAAYKALYLAYPAEVYFAAPAFLFITNGAIAADVTYDNEIFGYAGAILQVGSLGVMGWITGCLIMRCRENRLFYADGTEVENHQQPKAGQPEQPVEPTATKTPISEKLKDLKESELTLKWKFNFRNMLYLLVTVTIAMVIVFSGTSLRTMVYDINKQAKSVAQLKADKKHLEDELPENIYENRDEYERITKDIKEVNEKIKETSNPTSDLRKAQWFPSTTDGYAALAIYLSLYFAQAFAKLLKSDPYWEYTEAARELNRLSDMRWARELAKYLFKKNKMNQCEQAKSDLKMMQKAKELAQARHDKPQEERKKASNTQEASRFEDALNCWKKERLLNYFGMYMLLRGTAIKELEYEKDVQK